MILNKKSFLNVQCFKTVCSYNNGNITVQYFVKLSSVADLVRVLLNESTHSKGIVLEKYMSFLKLTFNIDVVR